jgi:FAD/FMN-containing dehydrogenase
MIADVEGMTTYDTLVKATLSHGLLPAVTPELKTITVGGAVSGLGIESSSFRFGLVHETVQEMEVLVGTGDVVTCSRSVNPDLFYCLPNSYGTLGYILRLQIRLIPAQPYVALTHTRYSGRDTYVAGVRLAAADPEADFVDGVVFGASEMYTTVGILRPQVPWTNDYKHRKIYYRSIRETAADYLRISDYVWRWDTDWFWCSKQFHLQNPVVRALVPPRFLGSAMYQRLMRLSHHVLPATDRTESVIQDVAIPVRRAAEFLQFLLAEIPILPIWICPFRASDEAGSYTVYPLEPGFYINFGFWDVVPARSDPTWHNRQVERAAHECGGRKSLFYCSLYETYFFL